MAINDSGVTSHIKMRGIQDIIALVPNLDIINIRRLINLYILA